MLFWTHKCWSITSATSKKYCVCHYLLCNTVDKIVSIITNWLIYTICSKLCIYVMNELCTCAQQQCLLVLLSIYLGLHSKAGGAYTWMSGRYPHKVVFDSFCTQSQLLSTKYQRKFSLLQWQLSKNHPPTVALGTFGDYYLYCACEIHIKLCYHATIQNIPTWMSSLNSAAISANKEVATITVPTRE